jgi:hypothetical protein
MTTRFGARAEYLAWKAAQHGGITAPLLQSTTEDGPPLDGAPAQGPKQGLAAAFAGIPGWAWPFVVACVAIPVVSLGGAVPGALGAGAAAACANVAKREAWETSTRVIACAGIAAGAWVAFLGFAVALASLRQ